MDLQLKGKTIAVGGATSGLGRAIAARLIDEGATVIGIARGKAGLAHTSAELGEQFEAQECDLTDSTSLKHLTTILLNRKIDACVFNAGGPPSGPSLEFDMPAWDAAYHSTLRWKIQLVKDLLPMLRKRGSGRLLFLESVSIKQPIDNLILSNVFRAGVAGLVKTLSREVAIDGITVNILAPGYHATPRITKILEKSADLQGISPEEAREQFAAEVPNHQIGSPEDFAAAAAFLLSDHAAYINGQTITVDGGLTRHLTG